METIRIGKPRVAFICTHNACRSQMAEGIARAVAEDAFIACSAGTDPLARVDPDALRVLASGYGADVSRLRPKAIDELGEVDVVVTMGCGVRCPSLPCAHREDWGLEDPTGSGPTAFAETARAIEARVRDLAMRIERNEVPGIRAPLSDAAFKALGDEKRLAVLTALADRDDLCACKLLDGLDIGQSTLSHHMKILVDSGLVTVRKDGRWAHYSLDRRRISALGAALLHLAE